MPNTSTTDLSNNEIQVWLTSADQSRLLTQQTESIRWVAGETDLPTININEQVTYQTMAGFGFSLTGGSAMLISRLPDYKKHELLRELFLTENDGIGVSFLRLSIGASDLSERSYSYNDLTPGQTDFELKHFDIAAGDVEVIPLLQDILALNPDIKIMATAWSAPPWMKTNHSFVGGELKTDCYAVYARYLVKYLQTLRDQGIKVHAITPQNEPLNHKNDPSMVMQANDQAEFIKNHLGPALLAAGLQDVEVFCWDHNCDVKEYPLQVFADADARHYLSGSAWHLYGGDISVLSEIHSAYPDKKLYFTEQWVGSDGQFGGDLLWHINNVLIGSTRNWSQVVLEWNLAADPFCCPHTAGGEARCVGALTIDGEQISRNVAYYIIAHAAKWVVPGSVRIHSDIDVFSNVAFLTPNQQIVMIVLNDTETKQVFNITYQDRNATAIMPASSVATFVWSVSNVVSCSQQKWIVGMAI